MKNAFTILALLVQLGCAESAAHKAIQDEKSEVGNKIAEKKFYFSAVAEKYEIGYVDKKMDVNMIAITLKQPTMIRIFGDSLRILNIKANFYMVDDSVVGLPNGEGTRVRFISRQKGEACCERCMFV